MDTVAASLADEPVLAWPLRCLRQGLPGRGVGDVASHLLPLGRPFAVEEPLEVDGITEGAVGELTPKTLCKRV
jgi:hypothetical protein